jgi:hypothetical protein
MRNVKYIFLWIVFCVTTHKILAQTMLADRVAYYPRLVRLQNGNLIASFDNGNTGAFYESKDSGRTWASISNLKETTSPRNCCSELYAVLQPIKNLKAGTLFWATSVGTDKTPRTNCSIRIYKSTDTAHTWNFYSTGVTGTIGLWEPEFAIDKKKRLVMFFSSEEYKAQGYNQIIAHRVSTNGGQTWSNDIKDVAVNDSIKRPGMPTVAKLPNGRYIMCYDVCGNNCDTYIRYSKNGDNWGDAKDLGTRVESTNGNHFSHAPTIAWFNDGTTNGVLLLIGQVLNKNSDNTIADNNGKVYMINRNNGKGLWTEVEAPVTSVSNGKNPCENYSSQLLLLNHQQVLGLALKKVNGACRLFYNRNNMNDSLVNRH